MSYLYDLHTHSDCSDGQLTPTGLVELAIKNGVDVLALTDHDTLSGIDSAILAAGDQIRIVPGIELSAQWLGRNIHIVGLNLNTEHEPLRQAVKEQCDIRDARAVTIAERLAKAGIKGALDGAKHYAKGESVGRPHFAQYLVDAGYVSSFAQAFKRYLGTGKAGDVKHHWPSIDTVVSWINDAGGVAVLAHPDKYDLTRTKLYMLVQHFVDAGGQALEVVSGKQEAAVTAKLLRAAQDFSLLASCGSDFHSTDNAWQSPGKMSPLPEGCKPVWEAW
ncbi:MAG: PHP domain-containing protein [Cellvibrionaceae bacterium]